MYCRDDRATPPKEFIRANPDGSEDLVSLDLSRADYAALLENPFLSFFCL